MSPAEEEILVSVDYPRGTAAVGWDSQEETLYLTSDTERGGGTVLDAYETSIEGVLDERSGELTVQGGRLAPGAAGCEVIDRTGKRVAAQVGNGAWVVVVDHEADEPLPVRFFDESGTTVRRPWPDDWERQSVEDATEPCPACGAASWIQLTGVPETYAALGLPENEWVPSRLVVCETCGHRLSMGVFISFDPGDESQPSEEELKGGREMLEARQRSAENLLELTFPIYRAVGFDSYLLMWSRGNEDTLTDVTVGDAHWQDQQWIPSSIEVRTALRHRSFESSEESAAREALQSVIFDPSTDWPERSEAGLSLWLDQEERERRAQTAAADVMRRTLAIDGRPKEWTVARAGDGWAAIHRGEKVTLTVTARGTPIDTVELEEIREPTSLPVPPLPYS